MSHPSYLFPTNPVPAGEEPPEIVELQVAGRPRLQDDTPARLWRFEGDIIHGGIVVQIHPCLFIGHSSIHKHLSIGL